LEKTKSKPILEGLSSQFFSLIPTNFGRQRPQPILTIEQLREKEELLKFYLRMGFEEIEEKAGLTPISGVMELPLPKSLQEAASGICTKYDVDECMTKGKDLAKIKVRM
jgi:hypothetical protein